MLGTAPIYRCGDWINVEHLWINVEHLWIKVEHYVEQLMEHYLEHLMEHFGEQNGTIWNTSWIN